MIDKIEKQCEISICKFENRVLHNTPFAGRSILMSEGFAVCSIADMFGIELFLESGVFNGRSTHMWANYFEVPVIAMDVLIRDRAEKILKPYSNVKLLQCNSLNKLPKLIEANFDKKIGVFVDGPKGPRGLDLIKKCYSYSNVMFSSTHDIHKSADRRKLFNSIKCHYKFNTDEKWFVDKYGYLDANESQKAVDCRSIWEPYTKISDDGTKSNLINYGPTIGFLLKEIENAG